MMRTVLTILVLSVLFSASVLAENVYMQNGNVGIGTSDLAGKRLHVQSSDGLNTLFVENVGGGGGNKPALDVYMGAVSSGRDIARFRNGNGAVMTINDYGRVGIGIANPSYALHLYGPGVTIGLGDSNLALETRLYIHQAKIFRPANTQDLAFSTVGSGESIRLLNTNGNVGIKSTAPQYPLDVNGVVRATQVIQTSDVRLKNIFGDYNAGLNSVMQLNPIRFEFKNEKGKQHVGFVAQDVQKILPDAVSSDAKGYLSIDAQVITAALVNAVQEQQKRIDLQQKEIEQLKQKLEEKSK